jgi:hypothetical protein
MYNYDVCISIEHYAIVENSGQEALRNAYNASVQKLQTVA